jgi:hypothetical protein
MGQGFAAQPCELVEQQGVAYAKTVAEAMNLKLNMDNPADREIPAGHRLVAATSLIFAVSGISRDNPPRGRLSREVFAPVAQPDRATDF